MRDDISDRDVPPWARDKLPVALDAEQAFLAALMLNNRSYEFIADQIQPHHFGNPFHGRIFQTISRQLERGQQANPTTLSFYFKNDEIDTDVYGDQYLIWLITEFVAAGDVADLAETIVDMYRRRRLAIAAIQAYTAATTDIFEGQSADDAITEAIANFEQITTRNPGLVPRTFAEIIKETVQLAERAKETQGQSAGLSTGLIDLDRATGGLPRGELTIMAGRAAMGKTALGATVAYNAACANEPVAFFSLEMSGTQIGNRLLSSAANLDSNAVRLGRISDEELDHYRAWAARLKDLPFTIDEAPKQTVHQISRRAHMLERQGMCNLIVVDYLGLIDVTDSRYRSRVYEIEEVTKNLKALAKELNVPLVLLVQISRGVEQREDKRPTITDLRDSGAIEQDAGLIMLLYRHEYYLARSRPERVQDQADWEAEMAACKGKAEVIIGKNRFGPTNLTVELGFDAARASFFNLAHHSQEDMRF